MSGQRAKLPKDVACAAMAVHDGATSLHDVRAACGFKNVATASERLRDARTRGLVDWEPCRFSTLKALVAPKAMAA